MGMDGGIVESWDGVVMGMEGWEKVRWQRMRAAPFRGICTCTLRRR